MESGMKKVMFLSLVILIFVGVSCSKKMSEKELFELATQYMEQENFEQAEEFYEKLYTQYPDGSNASKALFMLGFLNANHLNDFDQATTYYQKFLEKYPDHELAMAAKYEIENMGKTPDELPFLQDTETVDTAGDNNGETQQTSSTPN